ncbi:MAG: hypothetical protein K2M70_09695, partial [Lachnospiraceae bacterium]|nr:hypothetical protein [Lachnospiraceae bacterium]
YTSIDKLSAINNGNYNKDEVSKAFSTFVNDYNDLIKTTDKSSNSNVIDQAGYLKGIVSSNKSALSRIGVTVNSDKTLTIDEEKFKDADMSTVKNLFTGTYSFGEKMTDRVNQIYRYATQEDSKSNSNSSYTSSGSGIKPPSMGSMVDTVL